MEKIELDLLTNPLSEGEKISVIGFSGGGPTAVGVTRYLNNKNINVDNLGFIGTGKLVNFLEKNSINSGLENVNEILNVYSDNDQLSDKINRKIKLQYILNDNNSTSILGSTLEIENTIYGYSVRNLKVDAGHTDYFKGKYLEEVSDFFSENILD